MVVWSCDGADPGVAAWRVEPAPEPEVAAPVAVVREGEEVVRVGVLVVMVMVAVLSDTADEVVVRRVVGVVVGAAPGWHCEKNVLRYTQVLPEAQVNGLDQPLPPPVEVSNLPLEGRTWTHIVPTRIAVRGQPEGPRERSGARWNA